MRIRLLAPLLLGLAGGATFAAIGASAESPTRLAAELDARGAEAPIKCVQLRRMRGNELTRSAIAFKGDNGTIYLNSPAGGCPAMRPGMAIKTRTTTAQLCEGDIVSLYDPQSGVDYGGCTLAEFTPYPRGR